MSIEVVFVCDGIAAPRSVEGRPAKVPHTGRLQIIEDGALVALMPVTFGLAPDDALHPGQGYTLKSYLQCDGQKFRERWLSQCTFVVRDDK